MILLAFALAVSSIVVAIGVMAIRYQRRVIVALRRELSAERSNHRRLQQQLWSKGLWGPDGLRAPKRANGHG